MIGSTALSPGGPAVSISGQVMSLGPSGSQLVVVSISPTTGWGSPVTTTFQLSPLTAPPSSLTAPPSLVSEIGQAPLTLAPGSAAITLPGGTVLSLAPNPTSSGDWPVFVIGTGAEAKSIFMATPVVSTVAALQTITGPAGLPVLIFPTQPIVIAGTTLVAGSVYTIRETPVSLAPGSSLLFIGSTTVTLSMSSMESYGSLILNGIGGGVDLGSTTTEKLMATTTETTTTTTTATPTAGPPALVAGYAGKNKAPDWSDQLPMLVLAICGAFVL